MSRQEFSHAAFTYTGRNNWIRYKYTKLKDNNNNNNNNKKHLTLAKFKSKLKRS